MLEENLDKKTKISKHQIWVKTLSKHGCRGNIKSSASEKAIDTPKCFPIIFSKLPNFGYYCGKGFEERAARPSVPPAPPPSPTPPSPPLPLPHIQGPY